MFFQPILRHFLKTLFKSSKSFAARRSFWAAFKSSREAIAGIVTLRGALRLRSGPPGLEVGGLAFGLEATKKHRAWSREHRVKPRS
jgi:hypothetical protein